MNEGLQWTDWPAARAPGKAIGAVVVILLCSVAVVAVDRLLGFIGTLLLLGSVADFLFPTRYELTGTEVRVRSLLRVARRPWDRLGAWSAKPDGFAIAGRSPVRLLRRQRGVVLRCPEHRDEVEAVLRERLGPPRSGDEEESVG